MGDVSARVGGMSAGMRAQTRILGLTTSGSRKSPADAVQDVPFDATLWTMPDVQGGRDKMAVSVLQIIPIGKQLPKGGAKLFSITARVISEGGCLPADSVFEANVNRQWKGYITESG